MVKKTCFEDLLKIETLLLSGGKQDLKLEITVTQSQIFPSLLLLLKTFRTCQTKRKKPHGMLMKTPLRFCHLLRPLAQLLVLQRMELQLIFLFDVSRGTY